MGKILTTYHTLKDNIKSEIEQEKSKEKIVIHIGNATCENAAGAREVQQEFEKLIEISNRKDIIIKKTGCTGRCAAEPIVGVFVPDKSPYKYANVTPEKVRRIFHEHIQNNEIVMDFLLDKKTKNVYDYIVTFFTNDAGQEPEKFDRIDYFEKQLVKKKVPENSVRVFQGKSSGLLEVNAPRFYTMVYPDNVLYRANTKKEIDEIIESHLIKKKIAESLREEHGALGERFFTTYGDVPFFNKQTRLTLRNSGIIDPESIEDYIYYDGFAPLAKVLDTMNSDQAIEELIKSGLRGRGGGGFPTGLKWKNGRIAPGEKKYIICNADEGDPGAFMDRSALEGDPFSIIEGMIIGAYAIGAQLGYLYIRAEYPLAISRIEKAIKKARELNLLGDNILNSDFSFDLEVRLGAGAFVCGEETALIHSIEGRRGQPRIRPPYPAQSGLWGFPTVINNVETWANIPVIFHYGADWFSTIGTENSTGTKVFALAGKVTNTGLVEVPMGTTLREIIYDIGGGIPNNKKLKAIQTGGPSGGCIPIDAIDTIVDYDSLNAAGSIMGSGGMIVLDEDDCIVDVSKFFLEFTQTESCGKCTPCREGTLRMLEILTKITDGKGEPSDIQLLERLGKLIKKASLCGLGQTAPNPVLSSLDNFREEFEAHVTEKRCPTKVCTKLITYEVDTDKCIGCTACARVCPVDCISGKPKQIHEIDKETCIKCGQCFDTCKFNAIRKL